MIQQKQSEQDIKGFIFDVKRYAIHDGPGIRTTVFFKGCPLQCQWCHNPESWNIYQELGFRRSRCIKCGRCFEICKNGAITLTEDGPVTDENRCRLCGECVNVCIVGAREIIGWQATVNETMSEVEKDIIFYDQSGGGVTFSGGEPLMQPEFLLALLSQCQERGIHTAVDTSCYAEPGIVKKISEKTDLFLCDLKHMNNEMHKRFTGVGNKLILDNIRRLSDAGNKIIIRVPIIPGFNNDKANIEVTAEFVASLPDVNGVEILPYNQGGQEKSNRLISAIQIMKTAVPDKEEMNFILKNLSKYNFEVKISS